ncbi:Glucose-repressible protein [Xylographa bjoerkii]|nr:Glucose-repressible protein [Xylographa bjoerkii]
MFSHTFIFCSLLLASTSHAWPSRHALSKKSEVARGIQCPPNFLNTVFNTDAPQNAGWPATTWSNLQGNQISNWIGFAVNSISQTATYNLPSGASASSIPALDAAQIKICMDPTWVTNALSLITSGSPPQYLELFNEPDFSYMGFTPLTSPQDAAAALAPILGATTTTQFISPALAFTNSDWLTQFNTACGGCIGNQINIVSAHIYNTSPDTVISMIQQLHSTWPNQRIWITELAPSSDPSQGCTFAQQDVINWMQTLIPQIVNLGYVDRVFWNHGESNSLYPGNSGLCNPSLTNDDGSASAVLQAYGAMSMFRMSYKTRVGFTGLSMFMYTSMFDDGYTETLTESNAANYVGDTVQQGLSGASKEANKSVAKDSDASVGTRASAAKDAVGDKMDETSSSASASVNKEAAKH